MKARKWSCTSGDKPALNVDEDVFQGINSKTRYNKQTLIFPEADN